MSAWASGQAGVLLFNVGFSPFDCQLLPFDFFLFAGVWSYATLQHLFGRTKFMRRLKQLDRSEALPVNRIHGSGQIFSAPLAFVPISR